MIEDRIILLVGGYGSVGRLIAKLLKTRKMGTVVIAGRNEDKARLAAISIDQSFQWAEFDVELFGEKEKELVERSHIVVICLDQSKTLFAEYCLRAGKIYLDITAKSDFLKEIVRLDKVAVENKSLAIVSLGLCPGLTNLIGAELHSTFPDAEKIVTGLLLFLGEAHGRASVDWTLDNYARDFLYSGKKERSFMNFFWFEFSGFRGARKAWRFNFSDQHALKETFEQSDFETYLCFDSAFVTRMLHVLKVCRLDRLLEVPLFRSVAVNVFSAFSFGKTGFSGRVLGILNGKSIGDISFSGGHTGFATASFAVEAIRLAIALKDVHGVKHIHQVFHLDELNTDGFVKIGRSN